MEENKKVKISLMSLIMIVLLILLIMILVAIILSGNNKSTNNQIQQSNISNEAQQNTIADINENEEETYTSKDFYLKFLKIEKVNKNMIYSPLSINYALSMLNEGADGKTKEQIDKVLKNLSLTKYNNINKVLSFANVAYIRDTYEQYIDENYKEILIEKYNAEIKYDKFENATNVNNWIEDKTFGIIKNMIKDELVQDKDSKMLLINALAIDMEWEDSFSANETRGRDFTLEDGTEMIATTMNKETSSDSISYYKDKEITALTMNLKKYDDTQLEFMLVMPEENLSNYIESVTLKDINNITEELIPASNTKYGLDIYIPKFSFEYDLKLKEDLEKMGITDAFNENLANFSKMTNSREERLYVSKALHKAKIDFTERGVKAAAVTVFAMSKATAILEKNRPEEIKIDKPFMYIIKDKNTGEIWFVGTVYEPNSWEEDKADYEYKY